MSELALTRFKIIFILQYKEEEKKVEDKNTCEAELWTRVNALQSLIFLGLSVYEGLCFSIETRILKNVTRLLQTEDAIMV